MTEFGQGWPDRPDAAYAVLHELRHFVSYLRLSARRDRKSTDVLHRFQDGTQLLAAGDARPAQGVVQFVARSAQLTEEFARANSLTIGPAGCSVDGVGLERLLIAYQLASLHIDQDPAEWAAGRSHWRRDISHILSFFSQTAQRRYEKSTPELTVVYYPTVATSSIEFGQLGKPLLDEYKALLRLSRDAHTVLVIHRDSVVSGLKGLSQLTGPAKGFLLPPVPPRLSHLRSLAPEGDVEPIVFNLNVNGSVEILTGSRLAFRRVNNVWRFVTLDGALEQVRSVLGKVGGNNVDLVAHNFLSLALDLADRGEGALLFLCDEPTSDVFDELFESRDGLIRALPGLPYQELSARTRFTQLVGSQKLSLKGGAYSTLSPLLRDVCSIDGATVFSFEGNLLGFGCIVSVAPNRQANLSGKREGARSAAAKAVSKRGIAVKVSSDGDATLFVGEKEWATFC